MRSRRVFCVLMTALLMTMTAMAKTPRLISYQGRLTNAAGAGRNRLTDQKKVVYFHRKRFIPFLSLCIRGSF